MSTENTQINDAIRARFTSINPIILVASNAANFPRLSTAISAASDDYECLATDPVDCQFCPHTQCPDNRKSGVFFNDTNNDADKEKSNITPTTIEQGDESHPDLEDAFQDFLKRVVEYERTKN